MKANTNHLMPSDSKTRIGSVDALRGFALLGIIIANIPFALNSPSASDMDAILSFLFYFFIDKKFITIFSILFGFGFYMQLKRASEKQINFNKYFIVRMVLLYAIGTIHAFGIWNGDILRAYALGGIMLMLVRKLPVKRMMVLAIILIVILTSASFLGSAVFEWNSNNYDVNIAKELNLTTSFFRYLEINAIMDPWMNFLKDMPITLAFTFGNMLLGFMLGKINFFQNNISNRNLRIWLFTLGLTLGSASGFIYYKISVGEIELEESLIWVPSLVICGIVLQSLSYMIAFLSLFQSQTIKKVLRIFIPVGRTALTNYLLQSLLYVIAFYHFVPFFQLFGKLNHFQTWIFAVVFFLMQILISYLWLKRFKQGPVEYIWKKWSYKMATVNNRKNESILDLDVSKHKGLYNRSLQQNRTT